MPNSNARQALSELKRYTEAVCKFLGVNLSPRRRNHSGEYREGQPTGIICHYTASNAALGPKRPYGRLPVLLNRLRPMSGQGVGCHVVVWDEPLSRLDKVKARYPLLADMPGEVLFFGDEHALWHAGSANRWSLGIEVRNCGELHRSSHGAFFWNRGKFRYRGRQPLQMGEHFWEPFTRSQIAGVLWISRLFVQVHPIEPQRFLGHTHISSTRIDPGPLFPIHELRSAVFNTPDLPMDSVDFLKEFAPRSIDGKPNTSFDDPLVSEASLHQGLYRRDWDGEDEEVCSPPVEDTSLFDAHICDPKREPDPFLVMDLKKTFRRLGYYPGAGDGPDINQGLKDTIRLFQSRWKKRAGKNSRRWVQAVPITGKVDAELLRLMEQFDKQQARLVS